MDHLKVHYRPTQSLEGKARTPRVPFFGWEGAEQGSELRQGPWWCSRRWEWEVLGTQQWGCPQLGWR